MVYGNDADKGIVSVYSAVVENFITLPAVSVASGHVIVFLR